MAAPKLQVLCESIKSLPLKDRLHLVEMVLKDAQESMPLSSEPRSLGIDRGKVWIADDFDAPLPEDIQRAFDGEG